ncbi:MAG: hypothetical protein ACREQ9_14675 [Candidatus Binatia bacterium]
MGRGERLAAAVVGEEPVASESRVEIRRPGFVEWYVNSPEGLEQGFTLSERPAGEGPLVMEIAVGGARAMMRGDAIVFETSVERRLRYGELAAVDRAGHTLATHFEVPNGERLRIVVGDGGAAIRS